MKNVEPALNGPTVRVAENQPQYTPVTVIRANDPAYPPGINNQPNTVIMAFDLDDEERARVAAGGQLYVALLTYGYPQTPIRLAIGPDAFSTIFDLPVQE